MTEPKTPEKKPKAKAAVVESRYPKSIILAVSAIRSAVGTVPKDGVNKHFGYSYVSEREMQAALRPLMEEHGLVILPSVEAGQHPVTDSQGYFTYVAEYQLCHVDGSVWPDKLRVVAQDKGDKAAWKANTGAMKYILNRLFMLDTGDDPEGADDSAGQGPRKAPAQPSAPRKQEPISNDDTGATITDADKKKMKLYRRGFVAAEKAHGKDEAMKWHAINTASSLLGYEKVDNVPRSQADELMQLIDSYPNWWKYGSPEGLAEKQAQDEMAGDDMPF